MAKRVGAALGLLALVAVPLALTGRPTGAQSGGQGEARGSPVLQDLEGQIRAREDLILSEFQIEAKKARLAEEKTHLEHLRNLHVTGASSKMDILVSESLVKERLADLKAEEVHMRRTKRRVAEYNRRNKSVTDQYKISADEFELPLRKELDGLRDE